MEKHFYSIRYWYINGDMERDTFYGTQEDMYYMIKTMCSLSSRPIEIVSINGLDNDYYKIVSF